MAAPECRVSSPSSVGAPTLRPEHQLLLRCARAELVLEDRKHINRLAESELDWALVLRLAHAQGVGPLTYRGLKATCQDAVPMPVALELQTMADHVAQRNILLTDELLGLLARFDAEALPVLAYKGPELAVLAYGALELRPFGDLDLLVHRSDAARAESLLLSQGYEEKEQLLWQAYFERADGIGVDLHWSVAPRWDPVPASFEQLRARARSVRVPGGSLPTLGPEDLLLVLSIQFMMDSRSSRQRLIQLCDVAELVRSHPGLDWPSLLARARAVGARRMLLLTLLLARELLAANLPSNVLRELGREGSLLQLARTARTGLFRAPESGIAPPEGADKRPEVVDHVFYLRSRERWRDKLRYLRIIGRPRLRSVFTPSERDRSVIRLPEGLEILYYLVRPLRVLWQWVRTGKLRSPVSSRPSIANSTPAGDISAGAVAKSRVRQADAASNDQPVARD